MGGNVNQSGYFSGANKQTQNLQFNPSQHSRFSSSYNGNDDDK